ncbi:MAG: VIT1/CCC1 transporter family protein [Theionarchaea archaeon]|nr:VIT1/CCC1 transporter family protein [Theionarchaea archaeon]MBU7000064.1 VIT1/CCC1 transporter family protein [Theionarchaea archaeon]MBU7021638.1 VIT1/CCC1 transporter family protein [Theionarchaea archaeon]MBU7034899.1 VIT1/CCC1 transporter family protein [Theionarchaea archaeon]MBU7039375.1 VIT1/CCC1 transporter family protein [Theionarchaea archaeon]
MSRQPLDKRTREIILTAQRTEITEHCIYERLARSMRNPQNKEILQRISRDELTHYKFWKEYTGRDMEPSRLKITYYYILSRILGLTFGIKLMEKGEEKAQHIYERVSDTIPEAKEIQKDEDVHEHELIALLDEEKLKYVGSIVLGLNDALVELLGALAGFTLTLQRTSLIAMVGLITGIAASLSMAASEYLSTKSEGIDQNPVKASVYTGIAYVGTVLLLIFPYLLFDAYYVCLGIALFNAVMVIVVFTFYVSVVQDVSFKRRFLEMALISLGIAGITFVIGFFLRMFFNIDL